MHGGLQTIRVQKVNRLHTFRKIWHEVNQMLVLLKPGHLPTKAPSCAAVRPFLFVVDTLAPASNRRLTVNTEPDIVPNIKAEYCNRVTRHYSSTLSRYGMQVTRNSQNVHVDCN